MIGWLVGWLFWVERPFETVFQSISGRLPKRGRKRKEGIAESKNVQTTPTHTYCKSNRPLPYCNQNCRTPRHWKFTQHHRTTRPPPKVIGARLTTLSIKCLELFPLYDLSSFLQLLSYLKTVWKSFMLFILLIKVLVNLKGMDTLPWFCLHFLQGRQFSQSNFLLW